MNDALPGIRTRSHCINTSFTFSKSPERALDALNIGTVHHEKKNHNLYHVRSVGVEQPGHPEALHLVLGEPGEVPLALLHELVAGHVLVAHGAGLQLEGLDAQEAAAGAAEVGGRVLLRGLHGRTGVRGVARGLAAGRAEEDEQERNRELLFHLGLLIKVQFTWSCLEE